MLLHQVRQITDLAVKLLTGRGKRRGNVSNASHTSDEGITPVSSRADVNEPLVHPLDEALTGEEIDALRIREEDFKMVENVTNWQLLIKSSIAPSAQASSSC